MVSSKTQWREVLVTKMPFFSDAHSGPPVRTTMGCHCFRESISCMKVTLKDKSLLKVKGHLTHLKMFKSHTYLLTGPYRDLVNVCILRLKQATKEYIRSKSIKDKSRQQNPIEFYYQQMHSKFVKISTIKPRIM